jgi:DNA-binding protein YbaB
MQITIDTENLTSTDREILTLVLGEAIAAATTKPAPAAPAKKAVAAKPAPEPEPEPEEEDLFGGEDVPTMEDAVAAATKLVSEGKAADVKKALASVGAKRVSEVTEANLAKFVKALA